MKVIAMSDVGNVRSINQDYVRYVKRNESECLIVLCDGMGGHKAGEVASQLACDDIIEHYQNRGEFCHVDEIHAWMLDIINHAHHVVKNKSLESEELEGMGTTVVMALLKDDMVYVSHVGDSRAYLFENDILTQLTRDDTLVNVLVDSGTISKDEAIHHPQKNILLQAIGVSDEIKISFIEKKFCQGCLLLCSDGLYNSLDEEQIVRVLKENQSLEECGKELMNEANTYGGKDNIGFALMIREGVVHNESNQ